MKSNCSVAQSQHHLANRRVDKCIRDLEKVDQKMSKSRMKTIDLGQNQDVQMCTAIRTTYSYGVLVLESESQNNFMSIFKT